MAETKAHQAAQASAAEAREYTRKAASELERAASAVRTLGVRGHFKLGEEWWTVSLEGSPFEDVGEDEFDEFEDFGAGDLDP